MYTYSGFSWLFSRNQHKIAKQLYFNNNNKKDMALSLRLMVYRRHGKMCWYNFVLSFFENMKKGCTSLLGSTHLDLGDERVH